MLSYQINHDTETHRKLISIISERVRFAEETLTGAKRNFYDNEQKFNAVVDDSEVTDETGPGKENRKTYQTIHIPLSYAIACTVHT